MAGGDCRLNSTADSTADSRQAEVACTVLSLDSMMRAGEGTRDMATTSVMLAVCLEVGESQSCLSWDRARPKS